MAIHIAIEMVSEDGASAVYEYSIGGELRGTAVLDKKAGTVTLKHSINDEGDMKHFARVAYKLKKHWSAGELPKATSWSA
jgi:tRNA threonylcarbamoyladenosine modification (KEOPS) complex  Pcc1 subunit